mgnify:CR=1 FL=1
MPRHEIVRLLCHSSTGNYIDSICLHDVIAWFETATRQRIRVHVRCVDAIIGLTTLAAIKRHDRRNRTMRIHRDIVRQSRRSVNRSATCITPRRCLRRLTYLPRCRYYVRARCDGRATLGRAHGMTRARRANRLHRYYRLYTTIIRPTHYDITT